MTPETENMMGSTISLNNNDSETLASSSIVPSFSFTFQDVQKAFFQIIELHTPIFVPPPKKPMNMILPATNDGGQYNNNYKGGNKRSSTFPSRRVVGERIFGVLPREQVVNFYLTAVDFVPEFKEQNPRFKSWNVKNEVGVEHIFIQSFFIWIAAMRSDSDRKRNKFKMKTLNTENREQENTADNSPTSQINASEKATENGVAKQAKKNGFVIPISREQKERIVRQLIRIKFFPSQKIWNLVSNTISINGNSSLQEFFIKEVLEAVSLGRASFCTMTYCLCSQFSRYLNSPDCIIYTLLMGPLRGHVVEYFASNRSIEFREQIKQLLLTAESWMKNQSGFLLGVQKYAHSSIENEHICPYSEYISNVLKLMRELRRDIPSSSNLISFGWAHSSIKKAAQRTYIEKTWIPEQLDDLFHTIIAQRPSFKFNIIKMLRNEYNDEGAAQKWQRCNGHYMSRNKMSTNFEPIDYHVPIPGYLSLPKKAAVYIVDTVNKLMMVENDIMLCEKSDFPVIGLDAEWSPYVSQSKASLLQMAFDKSVYLIDLDALHGHKRLINMLDKLFLSDKSLKIGFQFTEDLIQIRESVNNCTSLYNPQNLFCIGRLITQLLQLSANSEDNCSEEFFPTLPCEDGGAILVNGDSDLNNISEGANVLMDDDSVDDGAPSNSLNNSTTDLTANDPSLIDVALMEKKYEDTKNMGLSTICQRMLGLPLDKSEQCSVWDRRPLRSRQIRYAALDAYCMLELYRSCQEWAQRLNVDINDLFKKQGQIHHPLPLFAVNP